MFKQRNIIVHEFDLTPERRWNRQPRAIGKTEGLISEALATAQDVINAVANAIAAQET